MMNLITNRFLAFCGAFAASLVLAFPANAGVTNPTSPESSEIWQKVRTSLFKDRPIMAATADIVSLEAPVRADDAAVVPISIKTKLLQSGPRQIENIYLIIDNNPSPIAGVFHFTKLSGRADLETRVRVDEYTHVRAIAETSDGKLFMATKFVKASGGCSAPPAKDAQAALATLGKMKFRVEDDAPPGSPVLAQLMISHPNNSGLAMDQVSRLYTPSHFVREVRVSYRDRLVMSADVDFSISENPNFRFYFEPDGEGELKAEVADSHDLHFTSAIRFQRPQ